MGVKWLITKYGQDADVNRLYLTVQQSGREVEVLSLADFYRFIEQPTGETQNVVLTGPCLVTRSAYDLRPDWVPGSWHNRDLFKCSTYYAFWGKYLTQKQYVMFPLGEVIRKRDWLYDAFGRNEQIFIRPDWGEKTFNGELVWKERFDSWAQIASEYSAATPNTLTIVSRPVEIRKEMRLVMRNGKMATGSTYRIAGKIEQQPLDEQEDRDAIVEFAERVASDNAPPLPPVYVMDVALDENGYSLMEIGCVTAAGFYACDLEKVVAAISEAAEEEWTAVIAGREASPAVQLQADRGQTVSR